MPQISVIVPVYNTEKYLHCCIDSILAQTFTDFELLLIDDGSKDNSGKICDGYAIKDSRVRVFHKENGGVSSARNIGLDNAKGKWITFVDSDDFIDSTMLETLYFSIDDNDLVLSYGKILGEIEEEKYSRGLVTALNFSELFTKYNMHKRTSPWGKLYKSGEIRFCEGMHIGEDALFLYKNMIRAQKILISDYKGYYYRAEVEGSLTKKINNVDSELLGYNKIRMIIDELILNRQMDAIAISNLKWLVATYVRRVLNSLYHNELKREERLGLLSKVNIETYIKYIRNISKKERILVFLLKYRLLNMYDRIRVVSRKINNNK